jgi:hypothetical protein
MPDVKALVFDAFGTVVDWRNGVARETERRATPIGPRSARSFIFAHGPPVDVCCFPNGVNVRCAPSFRAVRPLLATPSVVPSGTRPAPSWHLRENFGRQARQEYSDHMSTRGPRLPTHSRLRPIYSRRPGRLQCHRQRISPFELVRLNLLSTVRYLSPRAKTIECWLARQSQACRCRSHSLHRWTEPLVRQPKA